MTTAKFYPLAILCMLNLVMPMSTIICSEKLDEETLLAIALSESSEQHKQENEKEKKFAQEIAQAQTLSLLTPKEIADQSKILEDLSEKYHKEQKRRAELEAQSAQDAVFAQTLSTLTDAEIAAQGQHAQHVRKVRAPQQQSSEPIHIPSATPTIIWLPVDRQTGSTCGLHAAGNINIYYAWLNGSITLAERNKRFQQKKSYTGEWDSFAIGDDLARHRNPALLADNITDLQKNNRLGMGQGEARLIPVLNSIEELRMLKNGTVLFVLGTAKVTGAHGASTGGHWTALAVVKTNGRYRYEVMESAGQNPALIHYIAHLVEHADINVLRQQVLAAYSELRR